MVLPSFLTWLQGSILRHPATHPHVATAVRSALKMRPRALAAGVLLSQQPGQATHHRILEHRHVHIAGHRASTPTSSSAEVVAVPCLRGLKIRHHNERPTHRQNEIESAMLRQQFREFSSSYNSSNRHHGTTRTKLCATNAEGTGLISPGRTQICHLWLRLFLSDLLTWESGLLTTLQFRYPSIAESAKRRSAEQLMMEECARHPPSI